MLFLSGLASFLVSQLRPFYPCLAMHVPFAQQRCLQQLAAPLQYTPTVYPPRTPSPMPTVYTREQLLSVKPSPLDPVLTSRLRRLRTGFDLPLFRGRRGGRRKRNKIAVINRTSDRTSRTKASGVKFTNLISMPLSSDRPSTKKTRKVVVAVFNARSVGEKSERLAISDFIVDNDGHVLCLTDTWLLPSGDEAKCSDLSPPGYRTLSFPHPSRGGGTAFAVADPLAPSLFVTADFSFPHSFFELSQLTFSLPQRSLHIFCLYRPPPNRKNQLKDSLFMEQFPDLLEYNSQKGCSHIVGDFNFHYDVPTNTYTSRLIDLLDSFNLRQSLTTPTHRSGHILDWVRPIHRRDDDTLLSATTSPTLQSDHYSVLTQLKS